MGNDARRGRHVALGVALAVVALVALGAAWWRGAFLPRWVTWEEREIVCDLDGDGMDDLVVLEGRQVMAQVGDIAWLTGDRWQVSDAWVADVTRDGTPEVVLLMWRHGSYGNSRPFWETGADLAFVQHLCVTRWEAGALQPVWESSDLGFEAASLSVDDDGLVHLVQRDGADTVWMWPGWGFERVG